MTQAYLILQFNVNLVDQASMANAHSRSYDEIGGEVEGRVVVERTSGIEDKKDCVGRRTRDSKSNRDSDKMPTPVIYKVDVTVCSLRCFILRDLSLTDKCPYIRSRCTIECPCLGRSQGLWISVPLLSNFRTVVTN